MIKARIMLLLLASTLMSFPASAQVSMEPRTQGSITYISGGIGLDDMEMLRELRPSYNMHLLFASQGSGQYLAEVNVKILDQKGQTLLEAIADGPYFYAKVSPGKYRIVAESEGIALSKIVEVSGKGPISESFYWPAAK
ncbi:MAG TPA: carboxypeptidase regulatory-like domain-containing protein [Alphaproteobacteria bacterium]|nr:carboxypeptidase regulatory-like domain-containing protein [Alphaproteobacteria bacterium]